MAENETKETLKENLQKLRTKNPELGRKITIYGLHVIKGFGSSSPEIQNLGNIREGDLAGIVEEISQLLDDQGKDHVDHVEEE